MIFFQILYYRGHKLKHKSHIVSPGPAKYMPKLKKTRLGTTMGYTLPQKIKVESPGANRYNLQEHKPKFKAASYSFGSSLNGVAMPLIVEGDND